MQRDFSGCRSCALSPLLWPDAVQLLHQNSSRASKGKFHRRIFHVLKNTEVECLQVEEDGKGLLRVWIQQLQQFQGVSETKAGTYLFINDNVSTYLVRFRLSPLRTGFLRRSASCKHFASTASTPLQVCPSLTQMALGLWVPRSLRPCISSFPQWMAQNR